MFDNCVSQTKNKITRLALPNWIRRSKTSETTVVYTYQLVFVYKLKCVQAIIISPSTFRLIKTIHVGCSFLECAIATKKTLLGKQL